MCAYESPFGVPLQPFPLGSNWNTTLAMVEMVFADLSLPWVQNFVLRSDPKQDVHALTNPNNCLRAMSLFYSGKSIPELSGGFDSSSFHVRLNIPVVSVGDIGVGLGVECSDKAGKVFTKSDQFFRSVFNNRRNSQLNVRVFDGEGKIETGFQYYSESGSWEYAILVFNESMFLDAFDELTGAVDFEKINTALINSIIGGSYRQNAAKIANESFPYKVADNSGTHIWKSIFCSYANSQPMMAFPVFSHATVTFDYNAEGLRKMRNWGITNRLHSVRISPMKDVHISTNAFIDFILGDGDFGNNNNHNNQRSIQKNAHTSERRRSKKTRNRSTMGETNVNFPPVLDCASPAEEVVDIFPLPLGDLLPLPLSSAPTPNNSVPARSTSATIAPSAPPKTRFVPRTTCLPTSSVAPIAPSVPPPTRLPTSITPIAVSGPLPTNSVPPIRLPNSFLTPIAPSTSDSCNSQVHRGGEESDSTTQAVQEIQFVNIAPARQPQQPDKQQPRQPLTDEEKKKAKAERRKLQKREAAMRFNARKAAERRRNSKKKKT